MRRGNSFTDEELAKILALQQEGLTYYKIAMVLDFPPNKVKYAIASPSEKKLICAKANAYAKVHKTNIQRNEESNLRYKTDIVFRNRRKLQAKKYYINVIKPALELWRKEQEKL